MRDDDFADMRQQQEKDEAHKSTEKEQRAMSSTPTGKDLLLVQRFLSLHHLLWSSTTQNLGVASKVTTLETYSMFSSRIVYSIWKQYLGLPGKFYFGRRVALHKLVIARDDLHQNIDEPHRKDHQLSDQKNSCLPTYDLWSLGCILYHRLFGYPLCNFDCQQINSLIFFIYTIASISLQGLCFYFNLS